MSMPKVWVILRTVKNIARSSAALTRNYSLNQRKRETIQLSFDGHQSYEKKEIVNQGNIITVPIKMQKQLDIRRKKEVSKAEIRRKILETARGGSKSRVVIQCKRQKFNHYYGQSYDPRAEIPLASKGWTHDKSVGDRFTLVATQKNQSVLEPNSGITFERVGVSKKLCAVLAKNNVHVPTVIQSVGIPQILKGSHCACLAETGSGKTIAYLLPILDLILQSKESRNWNSVNSPIALVLAPTRELADQIFQVATTYSDDTKIRVKLLQGGNLGSKITNPPKEEVDLIISTVNVISTLTNANIYNVGCVRHIVLDEADTLLDDSFNKDVTDFLSRFPFDANDESRTQLVLISATIPRSVDTILEGIIPEDSLVRVETPGLHLIMPHVTQRFIRMKKSEKLPALLEIAKAELEAKNSMMVFCNATDACEWLSRYMRENGIPCAEIHGHLRPQLRKGKLDVFKSGEAEIIVCTDIASRGIDTSMTSHVFNFDFPRYLADYIHRCGRTGRVGSTVQAQVTNIITRKSEIRLVNEIELSVRKQTCLQKVNANIKRLLNARYGINQPIVVSSRASEQLLD